MEWIHFVILTILMGSASLRTIDLHHPASSRSHVLSRQKRTIGPVSFGRVNVIGARWVNIS